MIMEWNPQSLFEPTQYSRSDGQWTPSWNDAVSSYDQLTLDASAIASILCNKYPFGDRTLFKEIVRKPWMSQGSRLQETVLHPIPRHGQRLVSSRRAASEWFALLLSEARQACQGKDQVYLLLSGGLDSRVIAAVIHRLYREGELPRVPIACTWGKPNSRDVHYAQQAAEILGFPWQHIPLTPQVLEDNVLNQSFGIGGLNPPIHLHAMSWFHQLDRRSVVLGGSYGDSVGRAEFSGRHITSLRPQKLEDRFGLLHSQSLLEANEDFTKDLVGLHGRSDSQDLLVLRELEQQGFYMRNMIGNVMSTIQRTTDLYQMFTAPQVYQYMWNLHPAIRTNAVYRELLANEGNGLQYLPWARTNESLSGKTLGASDLWTPKYHDYYDWIRTHLHPRFHDELESSWLDQWGLFRPEQVRGLSRAVGDGSATKYGLEAWTWLLSFKRHLDRLESRVQPFTPRTLEASGGQVKTKSLTGPQRIRRRIEANYRKQVPRPVQAWIARWRSLWNYHP